MAEAVQSTLCEQGFLEQRWPLVDGTVGSDDGRAAHMPFDDQFIEVRRRESGESSQTEVVNDQDIRTEILSKLAVERVVGARLGLVSEGDKVVGGIIGDTGVR